MTKYVHIVQVYPVESGGLNLDRVIMEHEFDTKEKADYFIELYDILTSIGTGEKAVYRGRVKDGF